MIEQSCNETRRKMVMFTTAEVMTGFVVLGGLSLSGRFGSTVSEAGFGEMPGWRIYSLIDKAGSWMFWCGVSLFLVGFTIGSAILPALFMRIAAIGYLIALAASVPVVVSFIWRTVRLKQVPFFLGTIAGLIVSFLSAALASPADNEDPGDNENDDECHHDGGYGGHAFYNYATGKWDDGYDSGGIYLKDED
jgi:hypothetical protein